MCENNEYGEGFCPKCGSGSFIIVSNRLRNIKGFLVGMPTILRCANEDCKKIILVDGGSTQTALELFARIFKGTERKTAPINRDAHKIVASIKSAAGR